MQALKSLSSPRLDTATAATATATRGKHSKTLRKAIATTLAIPMAATGLALASATPAHAVGTGRILASPCLNLRSGPSSTSPVVGCIPTNVTITITCTSRGSNVSSSYGTTNLWDRTSYAGKTGFVSDAWVYTGSWNPVAADCIGPTPPPAPAPAPTTTTARAVGVKKYVNTAEWGWCTWGAYEQWRARTGYYPALSGNAKDWAASARARGWTVVADAQNRAMVVFQPGVHGTHRTYGHVGWVTGVQRRADGVYVTFTEMNGLAGFGRYNTRTVKDIPGMSFILAP